MLDRIRQYRRCFEEPRRWAVATVVSTAGSSPAPVGTSMAVSADLQIIGSLSGGCVESTTASLAQQCLETGRPRLESFGPGGGLLGEVPLTCGGEIQVLIQPLAHMKEYDDARALAAGQAEEPAELTRRVELDSECLIVTESREPAPRLLLFGVQDYAVHLARIALSVGWQVELVDHRPAFGCADRVPEGAHMSLEDPASAASRLAARTDAGWTAACVMTHHPDLDVPVLDALLRAETTVDFMGALGSRASQQRRRAELRQRGHQPAALELIHGPLGLDIAASTPAESAVSVFSQLISARNTDHMSSIGVPLSRGTGPIHHSRPRQSSILRRLPVSPAGTVQSPADVVS
ncbi:XdhC family protein [Nesterenkonia muleiensis]|uniref:XdhC family protein n=1 Tax=Nesterenkonia muleiensis TaxID=2282648 RepID=UPI000E73D560|nr:XdhC family protein [Nesterenkonia muleiensis]